VNPNTYKPGGQTVFLQPTRLFVGVVFLVAILAGPGHAEAPAATEPGDSTRLDRSHRYLSGRVLRVAESINNAISYTFRQAEDHESEMTRRFYGNLLTAYQVEGSHIRVTPRLIMTEGEDHDYKLDFSARLRLPDLSERLRLYVDSYDTDYDTMEEIFSARYRRQLETERSEGATAGLTYLVSDHMTRQLSLSTGMRFRPEPSPKLRLRGRLRKSFDLWRTDVAQSVFWSERDGFGEKTEFTLDRPTGEIHLFRLRSSLVWSELSHGVDWGQFASYYARLSSRRSAALKLGARGYSHPSWITDQYLVRVSWRRRVHRDWLFLEIEPGLDFFREDDYKMTPLINIQLEFVIGSFKRL
jgi:hypothetical protein